MIPNRYTDAPDLHPHWFWGSWQLLIWLFLHPTAWVNYVARLDASLTPDFALVNLTRQQWRHPMLHRLLFRAYILWPLYSGLLVALLTWGWQVPADKLLMSVALAITASALVGVIMSVAVSLAGGIGMSMVVGITAGVALALTDYHLNKARIGMPNMHMDGTPMAAALAFGLACAVSAGLCSRLLLNIAQRLRTQPTSSFTQRINSLFIGVPIAIAGAVLAGNIGGQISRNERTLSSPTVALGFLAYFLFMGGATIVRSERWRVGLGYGVAVALGNAVILSAAYGGAYTVVDSAPRLSYIFLAIAYGAACCILLCAIFSLSFTGARRIAGPQVGAIVAALMSGLGGAGYYVFAVGQYLTNVANFAPTFAIVALTTVLILLLNWWLPMLLYAPQMVWNFLLQRADEQQAPQNLFRHSAFWDEQQWLRLWGLDEYLVLLLESNATAGQAALTYLNTSRQRWAAQAAQIELDARQLERCADVVAISNIQRTVVVSELTGPATALLHTFSRISSDVEMALFQVNSYNRRMALSTVADRLNGLLRELTRSSGAYARRFYPIAEQWQKLVTTHVQELVQAAERNQEIDNPYVVGAPLTQQQEIFVGRTSIIARIEELLAARDYPPLLLYGQRRMGKTSLLHNLKWLLPFRIIPLFVDLQGPVSNASNHAGFLYNIAKLMVKSAADQGVQLPDLPLAVLTPDPFTFFDDWLDTVERTLLAQGRETILLTLDEFEALDAALTRGRLDEDAVLGMVRHIVQYRTRFKVLLAGSHTLEEFQRWASYLINAQTIHIGYLHDAEATQLIEQPVRNFPLRYLPDARQQVMQLTRGHPYLVQLLCAEIVNLKNAQAADIRRLARPVDIEAAIPETINTGDQFFMDIKRNQIDADGLAVLYALAQQGANQALSCADLLCQLPNEERLAAALEQLRQRELIEEVNGRYSFQVELIRRWFAQNAVRERRSSFS